MQLMEASEYLAALCCSQSRFLILSCSAYLACVQSWVCNERHGYTSPHVDGLTVVPHIRPHIHTMSGGGVVVVLCHMHTHKHLCIFLYMCPPHACAKLQRGGALKCGILIQVAMTDLEDVVDGGGQRLAYGGYV